MRRGQDGFSLVELLVAMTLAVVGLLGASAVAAHAVRLQAAARDRTQAAALARAQLERLRALPAGAPERQPGGSLASDVAGHFDRPDGRFLRRWTVAAGPSGTADLTVRVASADPRAFVPEVRLRLLVAP